MKKIKKVGPRPVLAAKVEQDVIAYLDRWIEKQTIKPSRSSLVEHILKSWIADQKAVTR